MAYLAPHFDLPFRRNTSNKAVQVVEQDDDQDVLNCVHAIVRYPRGQRLEPDGFGVDELVFQNNPTAQGLLTQIYEWEPRASMSLIEEVFDTASATLNSRIGVE
jgi:hypothetical protein